MKLVFIFCLFIFLLNLQENEGREIEKKKKQCRGYIKNKDGETCGKEQTITNEKECNCCYSDSKKHPTIGIGFNIDPKTTGLRTAKILAKYGLDRAKVLTDCDDETMNYCLNDTAAKEIFNTISYPEAEKCVKGFAPNLPSPIHEAIVDMAFMGCDTLKEFKKLQCALRNKDWFFARREMQNSKWCDQVGKRCERDINCVPSEDSAVMGRVSFSNHTVTKQVYNQQCWSGHQQCVCNWDNPKKECEKHCTFPICPTCSFQSPCTTIVSPCCDVYAITTGDKCIDTEYDCSQGQKCRLHQNGCFCG